MAVVKVVSSESPLKTAIDYIKRKAPEELQAGKDVNPETALEEMDSTKKVFNKTDGRQYQHLVQSFNPKDNVTPEQAYKIGQEFMEKNHLWKNFQVVMATHTDEKHIHNHFIVNSVNYKDGYKLQSSKSDYQKMKDLSNELSRDHGLSTPEFNPNKLTASNTKKYRAIEKGLTGKEPSYLLDTYRAVAKSADQSVSRLDFVNNMKERGYKTSWNDTRKHVTFTNPEGKKVRLANLEKTFKDNTMTKESLENGFTRNKTRDKRREQNFTERTTRLRGQAGNNLVHNRDQQPASSKLYKESRKNYVRNADRIYSHEEGFERSNRQARQNNRPGQGKRERESIDFGKANGNTGQSRTVSSQSTFRANKGIKLSGESSFKRSSKNIRPKLTRNNDSYRNTPRPMAASAVDNVSKIIEQENIKTEMQARRQRLMIEREKKQRDDDMPDLPDKY